MKFISHSIIVLLLNLLSVGVFAQIEIKNNHLTGSLRRYEKLQSAFISPRNVDVWLPQDYQSDGSVKYAVLYVHDGQNLFYPEVSFSGTDWGLDELMDSLMRIGIIRKTIVVGIWNTPRRLLEYTPENKLTQKDSTKTMPLKWDLKHTAMSDAYLQFIFNELKPMIDSQFVTKADMKSTYMMGANLGGLISLNALCKYPDQLKGIAGIAMQWPASFQEKSELEIQQYIDYYLYYLPNPALHKIYFDVDGSMRNAWNMRQQAYIDEHCFANAYNNSKNFMSLVFTDNLKQESEWRKRLAIPIQFLLKL